MSEEKFEYIRCLFCVTGSEESVVRAIEDTGLAKAIFPRKVKPLWKKDHWEETEFTLIPGYVFMYSHSKVPIGPSVKDRGVVRVLRYGDMDGEEYLIGGDRAFAETLLQKKGVLGALEAIEEGNQVRIVDGILNECNGRVVKVDKRKRLAKVEIEFLGENRAIWLAYRILEKR